MYCQPPNRKEVDWDALWKQRAKDLKKKYRDEHLEKCREYDRKYLEEHRERRNEIVRKSQRKRRAKAVENGLCCQCCIGVPAPGRKSCPKCLERAREASRKRAEKKQVSSI